MKSYLVRVLVYEEGNNTIEVPITVHAANTYRTRRCVLEHCWEKHFLVRSFVSIKLKKRMKRK